VPVELWATRFDGRRRGDHPEVEAPHLGHDNSLQRLQNGLAYNRLSLGAGQDGENNADIRLQAELPLVFEAFHE
jgi:hypothetical protein